MASSSARQSRPSSVVPQPGPDGLLRGTAFALLRLFARASMPLLIGSPSVASTCLHRYPFARTDAVFPLVFSKRASFSRPFSQSDAHVLSILTMRDRA
ncbi:hypothetical protein M431DRAFT_470091 [Trichoderma harzianum CBS 226.95]|uniref:Uncharacterized protein n=1 Tax=Trichoderma harzianum CBS 226.95 TaxID=983964 RepID=A0A2T4A6N5_TRIHA|nr:hypothetical protein M431DRAFT_470091 [Trichoderma harzianum CBS 226.95]PTB52717.1 hypothetical protein M431DRAFT_470091 [Trichoderma harzianum CBS 226.95]